MLLPLLQLSLGVRVASFLLSSLFFDRCSSERRRRCISFVGCFCHWRCYCCHCACFRCCCLIFCRPTVLFCSASAASWRRRAASSVNGTESVLHGRRWLLWLPVLNLVGPYDTRRVPMLLLLLRSWWVGMEVHRHVVVCCVVATAGPLTLWLRGRR